jgi:hypothetical protein
MTVTDRIIRVRILGVSCSSDSAYLAVVDDGLVVDAGVEKIAAPMVAHSAEQLVSVLAEVRRIIAQLRPNAMVLLNPEQSPRAKRTHSAHVPRIALETLVRLGAQQADCPLEILARPTVRSRLNLPLKGSLVDHVGELLPRKSGKNWGEERQLAAVAALAGEG